MIDPRAYDLAVQEAASALAKGDQTTYQTVAAAVTSNVPDRSQFLRDVSVQDAENLAAEIKARR